MCTGASLSLQSGMFVFSCIISSFLCLFVSFLFSLFACVTIHCLINASHLFLVSSPCKPWYTESLISVIVCWWLILNYIQNKSYFHTQLCFSNKQILLKETKILCLICKVVKFREVFRMLIIEKITGWNNHHTKGTFKALNTFKTFY